MSGLRRSGDADLTVTAFDVDREETYVFPVGDEYRFSHYFDRTDVFEALKEYYDGENYCFEVPAAEHPDVLRNSVANWECDGNLFFLTTDDRAVELAVEEGATPIAETNHVVGL